MQDIETSAEIREFPIVFGSHGLKLKGKILLPVEASTRQPVPGAILCHGFGAAYRVMEPAARMMAVQGIASLIFDFRGHGDSEGAVDGKLAEDVIDAWEVLCQLPEVDNGRMGIAGHSLGAMSAIIAADKVNKPRALVALSCPPEVDSQLPIGGEKNFGQWGRELKLIVEYPKHGAFPWLKGIAALIFRVCMYVGRFNVRVDWQKFIDAFPQIRMSAVLEKLADCSKLFVFCEGDRVTPYRKYAVVYESACEPKELILAKGGFHTTPLLSGNLRSQWTDWMVKTLKDTE
ncbi:MAG: alpha/beta fold hydrolase [Dehalococcoidia bacterium]|nr:alpha/beta fold hydrolase [Dehalococcoidia bacterium]